MKISDRIKLIGILCIVIGSLGFIDHIFEIINPITMNADEQNQAYLNELTSRWNLFLTYAGVILNALYVIAGILFIKKKSHSLKLMYITLSTGILYTIVSSIIKSDTGIAGLINYFTNIFFLFTVGIDVSLLTAVYLISGYYYKSPEESSKLKSHNESKSLVLTHLEKLTFTGLFFLIIPLSVFALWIYASGAGNTQPEGVEIFMGFFPEFLNNPNDISFLSIIFCVLAIITSLICLQHAKKIWNKLNLITLIFSSLLLFLNFFSLM